MDLFKAHANGQWSLEKSDDKLYRIHSSGTPITKPMTLKDLVAQHGPVQHIERDPEFRIVEHTPKPTAPKVR